MKNTNEEKLAVGIIGAGIIGSKQANAFRENPHTRITAVADLVKERAKKLAKTVKGASAYTDHNEMLKNEPLDMVSVVTPDHLHRDPVVDCAEAGIKNILCEKPLATTLEDARAMADALRRTNTRFMVNFENRWDPNFLALKSLIEEDVIGVPIYAAAALNNRTDVPYEMWGPPNVSWSTKSTCADFLLSHWTDLMRWMTGTEPETVCAVSHNKLLKFTPDCFQAIMQFTEDFSVYFESSWVLNRNQPSLVSSTVDVYGTEGTIYYNHLPKFYGTILGMEAFGKGTAEELFEHVESLRERGIWSEIVARREDKNWRGEPIPPATRLSIRVPKEGHDTKRVGTSYDYFIECVLSNREPEPNLEEGLRQVRMVAGIKMAAATHEIVDIRKLR